MMLLGGLAGLFGSGAAVAPGIAGAATMVGGAASGGFSLASLLQGTMTVLGVASAIGAGNAEAEALNAQADDAEREKPLETLQGLQRRGSIKRAMAEAVAAQDVGYAASGLDLSFGTARHARTEAFREADLALTTSQGTEETRIARLSERAANYRSMAKRARSRGLLNGLMGGLQGAMGLFD